MDSGLKLCGRVEGRRNSSQRITAELGGIDWAGGALSRMRRLSSDHLFADLLATRSSRPLPGCGHVIRSSCWVHVVQKPCPPWRGVRRREYPLLILSVSVRVWEILPSQQGYPSRVSNSSLPICLHVHVLYVPPHSTHELQPLDVGVFGPLATTSLNIVNCVACLTFTCLGNLGWSGRTGALERKRKRGEESLGVFMRRLTPTKLGCRGCLGGGGT